ncbi:PREDICTED: uncharacterized protein LOC109581623 [Amphimedon queenslandica]|uniref:Uncharacterized protein n=2 Tax=Amphimedon queenslandica TaxID=400682 RepID=A0AAN0J375_AMPQE|nr:PREDICTED: uncharacterized protein LOC109581623 [Amphimedon queenslandica]|eukprot:XP_019851460.1 PREDICTED: uncharacterized protein LOC109581623 [Amphimedon queenslandica]
MSSQIYRQPVERRRGHSSVEVGDNLYMWGGRQPDFPEVHNSEKKRSICSVVEVCHVPTGTWVQKPTTGNPPLGIEGYAAAVIRNEIFFFGGRCGHDVCHHNSLYSFNVDTLNWKELSPTTSHHGPMMKSFSGMVALRINDEDYLAVIGGQGPSSNTPPQPGAQYSKGGNQRCNEVHMYRLKTGEWTSPTVTGDRPPPISQFTLTSITNTTVILFGGDIGGLKYNNDVYIFEFTDTSVKCKKFSNPGGSVQWPQARDAHSSVLINCSSVPHLLVVGGAGTNDCWLLNINKMEWKELTNIPDSVTDRYWHSLSIWNETQTISWIIEFGGRTGSGSLLSDTTFIEIISSAGDLVVQSVLDINEYQKRRIQDAVGKWMEEGSVDLTVTRVNMLGAPGAGKTCSKLLLLNEDPPTDDTSTPIACKATRAAVCGKTWNRVTRDNLLGELAVDLNAVSQEKKTKEPPLPVVLSLPDNTQPAAEIPLDPSPTPQKKPDQAVSSETKVIEEDKEYHTEAVVQEILASQPKRIHKSDHWLYVIDSGGQPAYQDLLPLFTRAASLNIIALDLSKPFNERFDLMYRIDRKFFPCYSKSTQLAFFQSAVSTGASFKPLDISCISKKPTHSMHLVLGTHYDKVNDDTLREKEEILKSSMSSLQSYLQNCVIHHKKSIIFPVNTIAESEERAKYSEEICKAIWYHGSDASLEIKIPIRWFAFELSLPEQSIVSVKEALSIGERYGMKEEDTKQALRYFHNVSLMLYYPEVTNVVFVDSKPILEILSQLLALTYVDDDDALASISDKPLSLKVMNNLKEGFFNEDIFEHLKSMSVIFSLPEFQLSDLIRLLLHLNIITKLEDDKRDTTSFLMLSFIQ